MLRLTPELPYLDSAGHVYVPLAGPEQSCLKLNHKASHLWREAVRGPVDLHTLEAVDRDFLLGLAERGVLRAGNIPEGA